MRRLCTPLAFIVEEVKGLVFFERAAQRGAKLVLLEPVKARRRQQRFGIELVVHEVFVNRAVNVVRPGLGDDIHDPAQRATILGRKAVIHHAELAHRFL